MDEWEAATRSRVPQPLQVAAAVVLLALLGVVVVLAAQAGGNRNPPGEPWAGGVDDVAIERDGQLIPAPPADDDEEPEPIGEWAVLAEAPISERSHALAVWTGDEALIWGGSDAGWYADGAAYQPAGDRWRDIPTAPHPATSRSRAVWTGDEMVVVAADEDASLGYDPQADAWRRLPDPPHAIRQAPAVVWTGTEVVVISASDGADVGHPSPAEEEATRTRPSQALAYDPATDAWRELPAPPVDSHGFVPAATRIGDRAALVGRIVHDDEPVLAITVYDPGTDTWSDPDPSPFHAAIDTWLVGAATDDHRDRVAVAGATLGRSAWLFRTAWWDPAGGWETLSRPEVDAHTLPYVAVIGHGLLVWTGNPGSSGWLLGRDEWRPLPFGPIIPRQGAAVLWAGHDLLVWGGRQGTQALADGMRWRARDRELEYCCSP